MYFMIIVFLCITILNGGLYTLLLNYNNQNIKIINEKKEELIMEILLQNYLHQMDYGTFNYNTNGFNVEIQEGLIWSIKYNDKKVYEIKVESDYLIYYVSISNLIDKIITYKFEIVNLKYKQTARWISDINE